MKSDGTDEEEETKNEEAKSSDSEDRGYHHMRLRKILGQMDN